jgi:hypothetical protein
MPPSCTEPGKFISQGHVKRDPSPEYPGPLCFVRILFMFRQGREEAKVCIRNEIPADLEKSGEGKGASYRDAAWEGLP